MFGEISVLATLIQNAALLLAMMVVFELITSRKRVHSDWPRQVLAGIILGGLSIGLMIASLQLETGIIFDTRSVLLSLSGLFLGPIPTVLAMAIAALYRIWQGGAGAWTGILVILATGGIGILWRHYRQGRLEDISVRELYGFGVVVHLVMLSMMLTLPWEAAPRVLVGISLPVLLVYPLATIALGWLLVNRVRRETAMADMASSEQRFRQLFEVAPMPLVLTDQEGALTLVNDQWEKTFGYTRKEIPTIKDWWRLAYPDPEYRRWVIETWEAAVCHARETDTDVVDSHDFQVTCKNGDMRTLEITGTSIEDDLLVAFYDITARTQAETMLAESESLLSLSQEMAHIGTWKLDVTSNRLVWSDEVYRIFGCEPQEFASTYEAFLDFIHPDDRAAVNEAYSRSVREGHDSYEIEHRIVRQGTGEIRHVYERCVHVRDNAGAIIQSTGMVQDITKRKQAQDLNRESAERVKKQRNLIAELTFEDSIINSSIDDALKTVTRRLAATMQVDRVSVWLLSEDEKRLQRVVLYDAGTVLHSQIDDLNALDVPSYFKALRKDSQIDANDAQNDPRTAALTEIYFVPLQISSLLDSAIQQDGRLIGVLSAEHRGPVRKWHPDEKSFVSAITNLVAQLFANAERKQAEEAVRLNEEKLKSIFRVAPTGIGVVINRTFTEVNPKVCEMTGYRSEELLGKSARILYPTQEEHQFVGKEKYRQIAKHGTGSVETRWQRKDGRIIDIILSSTPVDSEDLSKGATFTALDITETKRFREELKQLNAELEMKVKHRTALLEASNKELEAFSYSVSHDLRAPLRHISGYVDLLNKQFSEDLPEKAGHYLNEVQDSAQQMGALIDDLLQFSRTGRQELRRADTDMNAAVQEVLEKLKPDTKNRNISWTVADLPRVFGDYSLLKQVWMNLLENAVKYTRHKNEAEIEVGFTREADQLEFFVRDNGAGFDMQYAHKLFGVFQRLHSTAEFEGTGIGLANVQRIVYKHGGRVRAEAQPENGATFYFTVPENTFDEGGNSWSM